MTEVSLAGKVVLVSGGTQGVGASAARAAARAGADVTATGRRAELGEPLVEALRTETGRDVVFVRADVADLDEAVGSVRRAIEHFGRVDALVNVAGFTDRGTLLDTTPELFDRHVAINLKAPPDPDQWHQHRLDRDSG